MKVYLAVLAFGLAVLIFFLARLGEKIVTREEWDHWRGVMVVLVIFEVSLIFWLILLA